MSEAPKPGIYENVPFHEYLEWDAISNSRLSLMAKSARAYKYGTPIEPKPYLQLGRLIHCNVLEESAFRERYAVYPDFHLDADNCTGDGESSRAKTTKYVKRRIDEFQEANAGKEIVPLPWFESSLAIVREIAANRDAYECFSGDGRAELSIVWEEAGLLCKARLDMVNQTTKRLTDLKSTTSIDKFPAAIANYGYHRQLVHYHKGWLALTGESLDVWIVAVESSSPHIVQAAPLSIDAFGAGSNERRELFAELLRCRRADDWPAKENPKQWNLPAWYGEREEVELIVNGKKLGV
jgi:hypothetical protein